MTGSSRPALPAARCCPRSSSAFLPELQVSELESLVSLTCSKGVDVARCRDVIEDAVRRARRKGAMLSHLDSGLLLSTLEVRCGIGLYTAVIRLQLAHDPAACMCASDDRCQVRRPHAAIAPAALTVCHVPLRLPLNAAS